MKDKRRLPSVKSRDFIEYFFAANLDPKKREECALRAGFAPTYAMQAANRILRNPIVNQLILKEMRRKGMDIPFLVQKHKELLECMHPQFTNSPDNQNRLRALDMAYKINDGYPTPKLDVDIDKREVRVELDSDDFRRIEEATGEVIDAEILDEEKEEENLEGPIEEKPEEDEAI